MADSKPTTIPDYIAKLEDWQQEICSTIHDLIVKAAPTAAASIKWAQPVYESNGPFAYIRAFKNHVTFGFWRGTELSDPTGLLQGDSDRMRHIKVASMKDIPKKLVGTWIKEAVQLNELHGNPTRQAMKKRGER